jgi:acetylornithine deacetylase/succinyl-diaminopimelate desuccinylase-like protein
MEKALAFARTHRDQALQDLQRFVRQVSISTRNVGIAECAALTKELVTAAGLKAEVYDVPGGYPVIVGTYDAGASRTLLFYNHYDVQPPEPVAEWHHDPFGAEVADGRLWGRGASDMKGPVIARLHAIRAWLQGEGRLPVNIKFLVEGEEETGSEHLGTFISGHRDLLRADGCVWEAGGVTDGSAEIICGCKGVLVVELTCHEGRKDLHSANAATLESAPWRLLKALNTLRDDETGRCTLDGYMEAVRPPTAADLALCETAGSPERLQAQLAAMGRDKVHRSLKSPADVARAYSFLPTCNIQGICSGYTGEGMKNVLPREATVKLDFRLVADQTTGGVLQMLRDHLERRGFGDFAIKVLAKVEPSRSSVEDPLVKAMAAAARESFGKEPVITPAMGGFGPMHTVSGQLGIATIGGGDYHRPGGAAHAPDEQIWVEDFYQGIDSTIRLLKAYSEV